MIKLQLEPAFVLHTRAYRETSLIVDFFTFNHGKLSALAKSARGTRSRFKGCLVPFTPLLISGNTKTDLLQLNIAETTGAAYFLQGNNLFSAIYLNELLVKLLQRFDPYPTLFKAYQSSLLQLQNSKNESQKILRIFEKQLLAELGYGLHLSQETTGKNVHADKFYSYTLDKGLVSCARGTGSDIFRGSHLLAIERNHFESKEILKDARRLLRLALGGLLGNYTLKSRELFLAS